MCSGHRLTRWRRWDSAPRLVRGPGDVVARLRSILAVQLACLTVSRRNAHTAVELRIVRIKVRNIRRHTVEVPDADVRSGAWRDRMLRTGMGRHTLTDRRRSSWRSRECARV